MGARGRFKLCIDVSLKYLYELYPERYRGIEPVTLLFSRVWAPEVISKARIAVYLKRWRWAPEVLVRKSLILLNHPVHSPNLTNSAVKV